MTKFEKYKEELTKEKFVEAMCLCCEHCPAFCAECELVGINENVSCEKILSAWCDTYDE